MNDNFPTCTFWYSLTELERLQNIFANAGKLLGLCWVVFRSRHFADGKRIELVYKAVGLFS